MKKELVILTIFLFLVACSSNTIKVEQQATESVQSAQPAQTQEQVNVELKPEFKLKSQLGVRSPPSVKGVVANEGLGAGTVKVTARIYYANVVAGEESQELTIKSKEEANFSMSFDETIQWVSYRVLLEEVK